jgi:LysM repeat protein
MLPVPVDWNPPKLPSKTQLAVRDIDKLPGVTKIHVVQKGETLWRISQIYKIPIRKIKYWNRRVLRRKYLKIGTEIVLKLPLSVASSLI